MKLNVLVLAALAAIAPPSPAAVSAEEAKQLGATLTDFGAIKAGNADGSIPAYTGGLTTAPAGYKPGSGIYIDPYKDEKPLYRIDAKNVDKYADKLDETQKNLVRKFPTYYIDVYPTHRTAAFPDRVLKATLRNATTCKTLKDNLALDKSCRGGVPFPIPKTGYEVMWDQLVRFQGDGAITGDAMRSYVIDSSGHAVLSALQKTVADFPYYETALTDRDPDIYQRLYSVTIGPSRRAGEITGLTDFLDPTEKPRRAWQYAPGQRRVKLAPEFVYDTPIASEGGIVLFDEFQVFSGKMDRFDFKLLGKKEMIMQYNGYRSAFECDTPEKAMMPSHANPACERWELHRVWVVEADLKPGMRHAYSKRTYFFDEDWSGAAMYEAFDQAHQLYRGLFQSSTQLYDELQPWGNKDVLYDFVKGMYAYTNDPSTGGIIVTPAKPDRELNAEAITSRESAR